MAYKPGEIDMGLQWEKKIIQEYHGELRFEDLAGRKNWINYLEYAFDPEGSCRKVGIAGLRSI